MTLDEFDYMIQTAGMINDQLNTRDIALHFNSAMMLQINEVDSERHFQATYIEFLEAFARAADQASIVLPSGHGLNGGIIPPDDEEDEVLLSVEERI